jgi:pimeloyl-ACP methyl ester carboxylesterase
MTALLALVLSLPAEAAPPVTVAPTVKVDSLFIRVAPGGDRPGRAADQTRAVVLIHGLSLLTSLNKEKAGKPALRTWQQTDSILVKQLAPHADVYAFAYTQTVAVEKIHEAANLKEHVAALKKAGYKEIVLVGHSAGGLIARHFVEDHPEAGVTKVVQVCAPNTGSGLAGIKATREANLAYLTSLSRTSRATTLQKRKDVLIPEGVEFACVVGSLRLGSDGLVALSSQWSDDLQKQRVPAHVMKVSHWEAVKTTKGAEFVGKVVREPQPRWKAEKVNEARKKLLGG